MANAMIARYQKARESCAWFLLEDWGAILIEGPDARDFLQRLGTADLRNVEPGSAIQTLFLKGDGRLIAGAAVIRADEQKYYLCMPSLCKEELIAALERFHFAEKLTIVNLRNQFIVGMMSGPARSDVIGQIAAKSPDALDGVIASEVLFAPASPRLLLLIPEVLFSSLRGILYETIEERGGVIGGTDLYEALRIEEGIPRFGTDVSEKTIPLEAGLKPAISFTKGCFPGQEIVARINNLGHPANVLVGVKLPETTEDLAGTGLEYGEREIGRITSTTFSPAIGGMLGLAYVKWNQREPATVLEIAGNEPRTAVVMALPLPGIELL